MAKTLLYHASFDVIASFWPLSHFGPRQAAEEALQNKNQGPLPRPGFMYRAELDLGGSVLRLASDQGTPRPLGYLMMLFGLPGAPHFDFTVFKQHRERLGQIYGPGPGAFKNSHPNDLAAREYVATVIAGLGYTGLEYVNQVEFVGSVAAVILRPAQVSIIAQESIMVPPKATP